MSMAQLAQIRLNAADPTRTVSLRREWMADTTRRHRELGRAIAETVGNMGLGPVTLVAAGSERFLFLRDPQKTDEFMRWLREEEARTTLELIPGRTGELEPWTNTYVRSSYVKGLEKANRELRAKGINLPSTTIRGPQGILGIFHQPFHAERASLIYQRTFESLKGIDATMNARLRQVLTQGILEGVGPEEIARRMVGKGSPLETIGITRGKLIARTEIVETYNQAAVGEYSRAEGIIGEPILVQWFTAEDERVRGSHASRHGNVYTQEEFLQLIGEPNCRCAGAPYIESLDGPAKRGDIFSFEEDEDFMPRDLKKQLVDSKAWAKSLSDADAKLVHDGWTEASYNRLTKMRTALIDGDVDSSAYKKIKKIQNVINTAPTFEGTVFRGIALPRDAGENFINNIVKSGGLRSEPMSPYSRKISIARKFAKPDWQRGKDYDVSILMEVRSSTKMKMIEKASRYELEGEVIATSQLRFGYISHEVRERVVNGKKKTFIQLFMQEL